ncbi:sodium:proton antiporter NhaD [Falsiporphyromonas endometrii]|uniref:Sodium:proton antiporter NhaD n=1 Tax=Falsiporphyromonas endometrii TaxID=1387297 RepID=A0ABV9K8V7_9PORP
MATLTTAIIISFVLGYLLIALEGPLKINKSATALMMCVLCWTFYMMNPLAFVQTMHPEAGVTSANLMDYVYTLFKDLLGDTSETLFFLLGAMTIVEIVDSNGGFNFVKEILQSKSKRSLLWKIAFLTFFLSAILDNLTTTIVMIMVLRKIIKSHEDRLYYIGTVVIAANSGGAFSPIGDVTTIMLWVNNLITSHGVISSIFTASLASMIIPTFILQFGLHGKIEPEVEENGTKKLYFTPIERKIVFFLGVGGLIFVPIFRHLTKLPPFMGILLALGVLWFATEVFYKRKVRKGLKDDPRHRVAALLNKIDLSTILFFLGILMAVNCLQEVGILKNLGEWVREASGGNNYIVTGIIGIISSIVDNVPLVAGCIGMYPMEATGPLALDGAFWQLLAYCAGVGGSMLIIGSAAGVIAMGLEKVSFGWYLKHVSWVALVGYFGGMLVYWIQNHLIFVQ